MKQNITIDQLQQLTPEQQERLREWWKPVENEVFWDFLYDMKSINRGLDMESIKPKALPVLSIGQCIELIREFKREELLEPSIIRNWKRLAGKSICPPSIGDSPDGKFPRDRAELIDTLWESVKEAL